jgi:two-component system, NtrC family, C4-dicarboxylate transport response regulator DctD
MKKQVLLIEDDDALRASLAQMLDLEDITVLQANGFVQARRTIRANFAGVILSDIRMPQKDGFDILSYVQQVDKDLPVIMLTGEADVPMALRAMKEGAYDFLEKPCASSDLLEVLNRALEHRSLVTRNRQMEQQIKRNDTAAINFPGSSQVTKNLRSNLRRLSADHRHVHLFGDHGVGKKLAAHTLHSLTTARDFFVPFNLEDLFERFEIPQSTANVSLKNLNKATEQTQIQLLQILKSREDLRFITSSVETIEQLKEAGLNQEFLSHLNPVEINVPTLAERKKDLPVLFESLLRQTIRTLNAHMPIIPQSVYADVIARDWSENLPALRNFAKSVAIDLSGKKQPESDLTHAEQMDAFEKLILVKTLKRFNGGAGSSAEALGLPRKTFYDRLARYDLRPKDFKGP